jgi:hypothetical protein
MSLVGLTAHNFYRRLLQHLQTDVTDCMPHVYLRHKFPLRMLSPQLDDTLLKISSHRYKNKLKSNKNTDIDNCFH